MLNKSIDFSKKVIPNVFYS